MSLCINNELLWISIPRCASVSIEKSLAKSGLNISFYKKPLFYDKGIHLHIQLKTLYEYFGLKESICIKRNTAERFISGIEHWWWSMEVYGLIPIIPYEEINNEFIYKNFTDNLINKMYTYEPLYVGINNDIDVEYLRNRNELNSHFSKIKNIKIETYLPFLVMSQLFWTNGQKCTYEFDFDKLNLFEEYISDRYKTNFKLDHLNFKNKRPKKIKIDDKFENWIYEKFEKRFINTEKKLI